ncbi:MAG: glutamate 5-kinase [Anaerolineae bacterium]|nr:glutamate 5-kinase [Anaerolineae bacterium]
MTAMRIVVKLGTSVLTAGTPSLNRQRILEIVRQIARAHQEGHEVILVTSGAVAAGRERLGFPELGRSLPHKQMFSAVGQSRLMQQYNELFDIFQIIVAQVLLTRDDLSDRRRHLNARDTIATLLEHRIIPIINENDTTATHEIRVGDNDNLSALVATLVEADLLIMLTDQPGLFTADPRTHADAQLIGEVAKIDDSTWAVASGTNSDLGTGGMTTKLQAAQLAGRSGVMTVISSGSLPDVITRLIIGEQLGTRFPASTTHMESRKRWLMMEKPRGTVYVDDGAAKKLLTGGASLLPVGIVRIAREFERGAVVSVIAPSGRSIAHGLTNYDSTDLRKICGVKSPQIIDILGYSYGDAVIHRNNMVVLT